MNKELFQVFYVANKQIYNKGECSFLSKQPLNGDYNLI